MITQRRIDHKLAIIIVLALSLVVLGFKITESQNQLAKQNDTMLQTQILLSGDQKVAGYSCGILTKNRAQEILKADVSRLYGQGATDSVRPDIKPQKKLFWADSCRYVDAKNSTNYVEFYASTFQTNNDASLAFTDFFPAVNNGIKMPSDGYGQSLYYDSGVYYLLTENRVIQIAASNGKPSENQQFARYVFESLLSK